MKTSQLVLLFALSAVSTVALSVQAGMPVDSTNVPSAATPADTAITQPVADAAPAAPVVDFIHAVKKIAAEHDFVVQEYHGVVNGMNDHGFYFVAKDEDKSWEITPSNTRDNPKITGTTSEAFQAEIDKISLH